MLELFQGDFAFRPHQKEEEEEEEEEEGKIKIKITSCHAIEPAARTYNSSNYTRDRYRIMQHRKNPSLNDVDQSKKPRHGSIDETEADDLDVVAAQKQDMRYLPRH
jgi:hypothetical protein